MKCRSVACIWSARPPSLHQITAAVVLNHPPTLYTGGADGSIFWWNLSGPDLQPEIKPIAMLCGHAMPVADLAICQPSIVLADGKADHSSKSLVNSDADSYGALISACTDGVLCVWSRGSGHCRRRRKLAPWIGSPSVICTLPSNPRYVCIGCSFNVVDESEILVDGDLQNKKPQKCSVVIVDTYTLVTVRTIFHGNFLNGSPKFMSIFSSPEDREKYMLALVDHYGRTLLVPVLEDSQVTGEDERNMQKDESHSKLFLLSEAFGEGVQVLSCAAEGNVFAFLTHERCIYRLLDSGVIIGEVCFAGDSFSLDTSNKAYFTGCAFLKSNDKKDMFVMKDEAEGFKENFIIWNNKGFAVVYLISYSRSLFTSKPLYSIPAASHFGDTRMCIRFLQLNGRLLRTESFCFHFKEPLQWKSCVTIWSTRNNHSGMKLYQHCEKLAEGASFVDWMAEFASVSEGKGLDSKEQSRVNSTSLQKAEDIQANDRISDPLHGIVSSSMVISQFLQAPHAIVYGYLDGEIELVKFDVLQLIDSQGEISRDGVNYNVSRTHYRGHTDAVVCLASHEMVGSVNGCNFSHVLISGSLDCTIRIWDLVGGRVLRVLHQHVSPIRQIILPPSKTEHPWNDCFLSVGDDLCVALISLQTLRVERMFPGHQITPTKVVWEGVRGYLACLCQSSLRTSDANDLLYIWDIKTGARERVLRGTASHSMFDRFCSGISMNSSSGSMSNRNTSTSSLVVPISEDVSYAKFHANASVDVSVSSKKINEHRTVKTPNGKDNPPIPSAFQNIENSMKCCCPFPGVATITFDLTSLMLPLPRYEFRRRHLGEKHNIPSGAEGGDDSAGSDVHKMSADANMDSEWRRSFEEWMVRFSLSFLHSWGVDKDLDRLLISDMKLKRPENLIITSGMLGDKGALTLIFPGLSSVLELWKLSSEFCAMRSLTMVSLAQRMVTLCHSSSGVSSALAAFYTRHFMEKVPDIKPPSLQLLVSFWQDDSEHVRMAARSLFHCAASSRSIPLPLCSEKNTDHIKFISSLSETSGSGHNSAKEETATEKTEIQQVDDSKFVTSLAETSGNGHNNAKKESAIEKLEIHQFDDSKVLAWLESYELQDWISCVGGTSQDAMTSHIIVAAALAIWYPSLVKPTLAALVVHHLVKLVMAMNEKYSSTAAELLSEGMESTWKACLGSEIPRLIGDIFFQIECVSSTAATPAVSNTIRDTLVGILLPSLAMADVHGFLAAIESQIWSTASDSPVHLVALATVIRVLRGAPKSLAQYLDKVINFILHTMDPSNLVMRKTCLHSSMATLKEVARVLPMVALNETSTRLAVGDAIGEFNNASIRVYDMQSVAKIKVLDASAPLALPSLLVGASGMALTNVISCLSFSPDGEGLVAFSEHGLMIRWWSLGSGWWEKLSRNYVPVQCTKLIFVPPWEGFSPKTARTSVMANIMGPDGHVTPNENSKGGGNEADNVKYLIHNLDISYRLEWVGDRKVLLTRHGQDLGTFQL